MKTRTIPADVVWLLHRDLRQCAAIEIASFDAPWTYEDFVSMRRLRSVRGVVAVAQTDAHPVIGYALYQVAGDEIEIVNLAVHPDYRRRGVGRRMLRRIARLLGGRRRRLTAMVSERQTAAHLFLRACGLRAVGVERGVESAYRFSVGI